MLSGHKRQRSGWALADCIPSSRWTNPLSTLGAPSSSGWTYLTIHPPSPPAVAENGSGGTLEEKQGALADELSTLWEHLDAAPVKTVSMVSSWKQLKTHNFVNTENGGFTKTGRVGILELSVYGIQLLVLAIEICQGLAPLPFYPGFGRRLLNNWQTNFFWL